MKRIAIEEHFWTEEIVEYLKSTGGLKIVQDAKGRKTYMHEHFVLEPGIVEALVDLGDGRIKYMDEAGIDMQVLSFNGTDLEKFDNSKSVNMARRINDELSKVIKKYPKRFSGFAVLAYQDPKASADELERAVKELGLKGAKLDSHVRGEFLDDQKYWPIFEKAKS